MKTKIRSFYFILFFIIEFISVLIICSENELNYIPTYPSQTSTPTPTPATPTPFPTSPPTIDWINIPGGTFTMGDTWGDGNSNEIPTHSVTLTNYKLMSKLVTNDQYTPCVNAKVCESSEYSYNNDFNGNDQPVVGVNWLDSQKFCRWVGGDLPTEAQFEYAAGGGTRHWKWSLDQSIFTASKYCGDPFSTCKVGNYEANNLGLYDMGGNVWEWCLDYYWLDWYSQPLASGTNPVNNNSSVYRVVRGGYCMFPDSLRVTFRHNDIPDYGDKFLGFRCAALP